MEKIVIIDSQYRENYGAHDWDGQGECPQYWKSKGGSSYIYTNATEDEAMAHFKANIQRDTDYSKEYAIGMSEIEVPSAQDYLTDYEKSQLEYEGAVVYPEARFDLATVNV